MAVKLLGKQETTKQQPKTKSRNIPKQKPPLKEYKASCKDWSDKVFNVVQGKLTNSGWLLIETSEWVGFIHGASSVVTNLLDEVLPELDGKQGYQLVAIISSSAKCGFVLGVDDENTCWYSLDTDSNSFECSLSDPGNAKKQDALVASMFTIMK